MTRLTRVRIRSSRRLLQLALAAALFAALTSIVLIVRGWPGTGGGRPADFGDDTLSRPSPPAASSASASPSGTPAPHASATPPRHVPAPVTVSLPRSGVRAPVDAVGVAPDGQVEVPGDPRRVGWYRYSPAAGAAAGSTVLVGHVDARGRGLGVLVALNEVREGDQVLVGRADGSTVRYEIVSRRTLDKKALAASDVFRLDGPAVLNLVTCAGPYVEARGGYQNNLVVTAVREPR